MKAYLKDWGKLIAWVIGFLSFPLVLLGVLAAFSVELKEALTWTAIVVGTVYGGTGLIISFVELVRRISRKETIKILEERKASTVNKTRGRKKK